MKVELWIALTLTLLRRNESDRSACYKPGSGKASEEPTPKGSAIVSGVEMDVRTSSGTQDTGRREVAPGTEPFSQAMWPLQPDKHLLSAPASPRFA